MSDESNSANGLAQNLSERNLIDLETPGTKNLVAKRIHEEINAYTAKIYDDGFRWHLGASKIGSDCKRELWYSFRWVYRKPADGRLQRLFNRGHREEPLHAEWLRGIGFTVWTHDESKPRKPDGSFPQLRINNKCKGHFGGSLDGIVEFPYHWNISGYAILESKTSGTGAKFNEIGKAALSLSKPAHFAQNSIYGESYNIEHLVYICANKNDDDLAIKVEKLDFKLAKNLEVKAESIIFSQTPPPKISENPTYLQCKSLCDFKEVCHNGKPAVKNCRSCYFASAVDNAEFYCSKWNGVIPRDEVPNGCPQWESIIIDRKPVGKVISIPVTDSLFEIKSGTPPETEYDAPF